MTVIMKILWLLVSTLVLHQAVAMESVQEPIKEMSEINPAMTREKAMVVPCNATAYCPDGNTCCRLASGDWGCCPLPNAVCCSDGEHCCPSGYTCSGGQCQRGFDATKLLKKKPAIQAMVVPCNATAYCPDGNTCCRLASGDWGCCRYPNAVCCSDGEHCCPSGYTCSGGQCQRGFVATKLLKKKPAIQAMVVQCNATAYCPDGNTCCRLASGAWGCCRYPNAVCCSDGEHCCPSGYTCSGGQCQRGFDATKLLKKKPAIQVKNVICPDGESACPDGNTCCKLASGEWGCCPLPNAVCCSDHEHCCPQGYTCDVSAGKCNQHDQITDIFRNKPAMKIPKVKDVPCPGEQSACPDGNTCCKLPSGEWGCCPLPNAVCCSDHEHCCPQGYTCDVSAGTCNQHGQITDIFLNKPAIQIPKANNVVCPGGQYECPGKETCCKPKSGAGWGCCPFEKAECCSDGEHCCPNGYTCGPKGEECVKKSHVTKLFQKQSAIKARKTLKIKTTV